MTECTKPLAFPFFKGAELTGSFTGGSIVTDAGLLLVRELDERIGFTQELADALYDSRHRDLVTHSQTTLLRQRLYQIIAGYEDANDATLLRHDPIFKAIAGRAPEDLPLASQPTLSRLENRVGFDSVLELSEQLVRLFIRTRPEPLREITLDLDPSEAPTYGDQQLTFFNAFYDTWMYFPNFLTDAKTGFILAPILRPGNVGPAQGSLPLLARVVELLRAAWPGIRIDFRGDSSFAVPELLTWLEEEEIPYVIGMGTNKVLEALSADFVSTTAAAFAGAQRPVKGFTTFRYAAETWEHPRRILVKCESSREGNNVRYAIATRGGRTTQLFDWYHQRGGTIENVLEQLKNGFEGDRLSCHAFAANAFRLVLHAAAYNLMVLFREHAAVPEIRNADIQTIRLKLIKVGARVERTVRRIWIRLSSTWPFASLFHRVHAAVLVHPGG